MFNVWTAERPSLKEEHYPEEELKYYTTILYIYTILADPVFVFIFPKKTCFRKQNKTTLLVQHVNLCVEKMDDRGIFTAQLLVLGLGYCY